MPTSQWLAAFLSATLLLATPAGAQERPAAHCHASVVTKLMLERLADGTCPSYALTARGREMDKLAGNVVAYVAAGDARSECLREGQRQFDAAVQALGADVDRAAPSGDPRPCRVAALFFDRLRDSIPGEPYYQRK